MLIAADGTIGSWIAAGRDGIERLVQRTVSARSAGPPAGLAIGKEAPSVERPGLDGRPISLASFRGEDLLLLFWNPGCGFCRSMRPELHPLEKRADGRGPKLVVVSSGDVASIRAEGFGCPVLVDEGFSVGGLFGARGTPMALLVGADGRVASELAAGAEAVLALAAREIERAPS